MANFLSGTEECQSYSDLCPYRYLWKDFQENSDDEVDEKTSEEYLRDLDIEYHERALLANSKSTTVLVKVNAAQRN
ncbi:hypothetical protein Tco_0053962 [Tanacetum coccineum]